MRKCGAVCMISETRTIYFEQDDLLEAVGAHRNPDGSTLSRGKLVDVRAELGVEDRIVLRYITDRGASEVMLSYEDMAEVLILRCKPLGIPMPRRGRKHIAPADGAIALIVQLSERFGEAFDDDMARMEAMTRRAMPEALAAGHR